MGSSCLGWLGKTFLLENIHNRTHWINPNNLQQGRQRCCRERNNLTKVRWGCDRFHVGRQSQSFNPSELTGNPLKCFIRSAGRVRRRVLRLVCERNAGKMWSIQCGPQFHSSTHQHSEKGELKGAAVDGRWWKYLGNCESWSAEFPSACKYKYNINTNMNTNIIMNMITKA